MPIGGPLRHGDLGDGTYRNPILAGDYSDPDVIRVGEDYYLITSTFQYSPGMALLHSRDLVNWQFIGHCVPDLTQIGPELNWDRMNRYDRGIYAGALRHHEGRFWVYFTTLDEGVFVTTAEKPEGPWTPVHRLWDGKGLTRAEPNLGWDDPCPFWDTDGQAYLLLSNPVEQWHTYLFPMSWDGLTLDVQGAIDLDPYRSSEGNKLYRRNGYYYVFHNECTPGGWDNRIGVMLRATDIRGPYEKRTFLYGAGETKDREPCQGALIDTPDGRWFFITHQGRCGYYEGRPSSLLPVEWVEDWPHIATGHENPESVMLWHLPKPLAGGLPRKPQADDDFTSSTLSPHWEWNFQPRAEKWSLTERAGALRLHAFPALKPADLRTTGNILTQRLPSREGGRMTVRLNLSGMVEGQIAGICHFSRDFCELAVRQQDGRWIYAYEAASASTSALAWSGTLLYLRLEWNAQGLSRSLFSTDGELFTAIGGSHTLQFSDYRGSRLGIFTRNDSGEAGWVDVEEVRVR